MLVLSRKENERLVIDGNIVIQVVHISGGQVRIGIEAPRNVSIKREELLSRSFPEAFASAHLPAPHRSLSMSARD